jgi:carboxymethylenebutenolidase
MTTSTAGSTGAGSSSAPRFAEAQVVAPADRRIQTTVVDYASPAGSGPMRGYLAVPAGARRKLPGVVVAHENRGLNPHIEDIARRLALEGFAAFAPDALAPVGGYPGDEDQARALFAKLDRDKILMDFVAGAAVLEARPECTGKVGAIGFCFGGGIANALATLLPALGAAVPFYGSQPAAADVARINAPLMLHYADTDERINAGIDAYEAALRAAHVKYQLFRYPGTQHGFHNDTTPRYDKAAAQLAWKRTVAFLHQQLG